MLRFDLLLKICVITSALMALFIRSCEEDGSPSDVLHYPDTPISEKKEIKTEHYHGTEVLDPYHLFEDMESSKTKAWVDSQEIFLDSFLQNMPQTEYVNQRLSGLTDYDLFTVPKKRGNEYYYLKIPAGEDCAFLMVENKDAGYNDVLIDPDQFFDDEDENITYLGSPGFYVDHMGSNVALLTADGPSRWYAVKVFDIETQSLTSDLIEGVYNTSQSIIWDRFDRGFFYVKYEREGGESSLTASPVWPKVYYHRLNTSPEQDRLIYESVDKSEILSLAASREMDQLVIHSRKGSSSMNKVLIVDINSDETDIIELFGREDAYYFYLGNKQDKYWFYTDLNASNGRVISFTLANSYLEEVVPEADEPISGGSLVGGNALGLFGDTFVIMYTKHGVPFIRGFSTNGELQYEQELPIDGSVWGGFRGTQDQDEFYFQFLGFTDPSSIYTVNASTGQRQIQNQSEIAFNSDEYITKQVFYESKDGTQIPMFVTHKKGMKMNGNNPAFMYAYGAFGWNSFLWYQPHLLVWLEQGGVYAQPSIRGGGEYGKKWHEDGIGLNRQNAVDDYIAGAEWLIEEGYSSPAKLVLNGGSASGPLAGSVMIQRPDLFGATIIDRPALDMVRYSEFTVAKSWVQEFGDPNDKEEFETLYKLSPYHNIEPNVCYPPTLVMAGELDEVTPPFHAYKFVAKLQNTVLECQNPYLLKIIRNTGHNFGATPELVIDSRAAELLFLFKTLEM